MSGIAGIVSSGKEHEVEGMLNRLSHRGCGLRVFSAGIAGTFGCVSSGSTGSVPSFGDDCVQDWSGDGRFARAYVKDGSVVLERDPLGVAPLYYGWTDAGHLCFASEIKALLHVTNEMLEIPPGSRLVNSALTRYFDLHEQKLSRDEPCDIAATLRRHLESAVKRCLDTRVSGAWLSGGLDSSIISAIAVRNNVELHTFTAGLSGAPDLAYARVVANSIKSQHHEAIVKHSEIFDVLSQVIYHLESFDALLVRSSVMNYFAGKIAADYVQDILSGEGADELFAGYKYLKALPRIALSDELIDITRRLHNTALQRVDRCASAHGLTAQVPFLDPETVNYAMRIPVEYKLKNGVEKWILREAFSDMLPESVVRRPKAKFWEGTGVGAILNDYGERMVSDADFERERRLSCGEAIRSKEELMYYRFFKERFGEMRNLAWMGRTKRLPSELGVGTLHNHAIHKAGA